MNLQSVKIVTCLAIVAGLLSAAPVVWAKSVQIPLQGENRTVNVDPGRQWTDEDGILHIRGLIQTSIVEMQDENGVFLIASGQTVANLNLDLATGNGDASFHTTLDTCSYGELQGSFEGSGSATYTGFVAHGEYSYAHGGGDFAGWHTRGTYTGVFSSGVNQIEGVLHNPHGE